MDPRSIDAMSPQHLGGDALPATLVGRSADRSGWVPYRRIISLDSLGSWDFNVADVPGQAVLLILTTTVITMITALSMSAISTNGLIKGGMH